MGKLKDKLYKITEDDGGIRQRVERNNSSQRRTRRQQRRKSVARTLSNKIKNGGATFFVEESKNSEPPEPKDRRIYKLKSLKKELQDYDDKLQEYDDKLQKKDRKLQEIVPSSSEETPNKEPIPSGATILLKELEHLIKANFQFYAGRPIDNFQFNAFNSNNRKLSILAETIEQKKNYFTIEDTEYSLEPLGLSTQEDLEKLKNDIRTTIETKGVNTKKNVVYSKSKQLNSLQNKLNVDENDIDDGLFKIDQRTYIRLPMSADGNCMYYSILISDYLESFLNNKQTPSIVDIYGNPYISLALSNTEVSNIFRQSIQGESRNLIVNSNLNLDIVARKFKQDLYRSWIYRFKDFENSTRKPRLGIGYFFKENEVKNNEGEGNSKQITEFLSSSREKTYMQQINNEDLDNYFNFVFNDGYSIDEENNESNKYLLGGEDGIDGDKEKIIESNINKDEFNKMKRIWGTATELLFILIRFRNLRIAVYDINPRMPNQGSYIFDLKNYDINDTTDEEIKNIYLLYNGIHYDVLVDTAILDRIV
jgi:hypothetical protein